MEKSDAADLSKAPNRILRETVRKAVDVTKIRLSISMDMNKVKVYRGVDAFKMQYLALTRKDLLLKL